MSESRESHADKYMDMTAVQAATGLSKSAIYSARIEGRFPEPVLLVGNRPLWLRTDIEAVVEQRKKPRANPTKRERLAAARAALAEREAATA